MNRRLPSTCIVGGGLLGATAAKYLRDYDIPCEIYDRAAGPHGVGRRATDLASFLERNALGNRFHYGVGVENAERVGDGSWRIELDGGGVRGYDALVCACRPRMRALIPPVPGHSQFRGKSLHAGEFSGPASFAGRRVLILGIGVPAERIAAQLLPTAARVVCSTVAVQEESEFGAPGRVARSAALLAEPGARRRVAGAFLRRRLRVAPMLARFEEDRAVFADGSTEVVDSVVYATGQLPVFDFLDTGSAIAGGRRFSLYKRLLRPEIDNLFFVGAFLPDTDNVHAVAMQAVVVAEFLRGSYALPTLPVMRDGDYAEWTRQYARMESADPAVLNGALARYTSGLERELRAGRKRALATHGTRRVPSLISGVSGIAEKLPSKAPLEAGEPEPVTRPSSDRDRAA